MRNNNPHTPSSDEPIVLRLNLHIHDHSGKLRRRGEGAELPARPVEPSNPSELLSESALDRGRLEGLLNGATPAAVDTGAEPDIEVTLVLYV